MVRFKNRWLLVELIPVGEQQGNPTRLEAKQIWAALRESIQKHFGDVGWGSVSHSLTVKYFSPTTSICIIRVARDHHRVARGGVTLLDSIEGIRIVPYVIDISGTIKHAQLSAIEHNRKVIAQYRARAQTSASYQDSYDDYLEASTNEIQALRD
ncbi:uncharacterized protein BT62DRAFT_951818 [Guyanagaster necrorhizus]|uniref:Uncharacterized protein n=1 Tax=Guyanagaster necrorhizus TaxID=856835 RepID=A0A9P8ARD4_9AGAR|nr:uncharacterized protein BT62DRAFT_951818 [Guyanagaster necrorhizus MCA 3950]KAG7444771.1 hypothetical protein BT62DRAFT_951818 [Guyanagaster necrorhizus MCA 3950]